MEAPEGLYDILDELNINSLDDSDLEAGLDGASDISGVSGVELGADGSMAETSSDSALSADIRTALDDQGGDEGDHDARAGVQELERRLRLGVIPSVSGAGLTLRSPTAVVATDAQHQLTRAVLALSQEQAAQVQQLESMQREVELRQSLDLQQRSAKRASPEAAVDMATAVFRMQMSDLNISDAHYQALREKHEDELNIREWVQLRFHEAREAHRSESERLRLEVEALRENAYSSQTSAERAQRQLQRREAALKDLQQELQRQDEQTRTRQEQLVQQLRAREKEVEDLKDKGLRFDAVAGEAQRLRQEVASLLEAMAMESSSSHKLAKDHADTAETMMQLDNEHRMLKKDAEAHERQARMLEETLARRDEEVTDLRAKVESLKEKKKDLVRKAAEEQAGISNDAREKVDVEIQRLRERSQADLDSVRENLNALHAKEVQMLQERLEAGNSRTGELQRRLEDEEHAHQQLQLSSTRVRGELQNDITELTGSLKLRAFEAERAALLHEDVSRGRQQMEAQSEQLKQQVEVLKREYYTLEVQHREGRATERAELVNLREQLRAYGEVERELDASIRACAEGPAETQKRGMLGQPQSVDEALLLGTTLASAPTSSQRRIQQSLLLAQELQRRTRDLGNARSALAESEAEVTRVKEELEVIKKELHYSSEPQAYLLDALRRREQEVLDIRRQLRSHEEELERSRHHVETVTSSKIKVEEDLKKLLAQRQHVQGLKALLGSQDAKGSGGDGEGLPIAATDADVTIPRRGRAPSQALRPALPISAGGVASGVASPAGLGVGESSAGAQDSGNRPAWFQRLKSKISTADAPPGISGPVQTVAVGVR